MGYNTTVVLFNDQTERWPDEITEAMSLWKRHELRGRRSLNETGWFGWAHVTPHVLRHTAATRWLRQGIPIWHVAGLLGDTVQTVSATYGHHATADLRAAMNGRMG